MGLRPRKLLDIAALDQIRSGPLFKQCPLLPQYQTSDEALACPLRTNKRHRLCLNSRPRTATSSQPDSANDSWPAYRRRARAIAYRATNATQIHKKKSC
jgi:hypothetical protein